jgi:alkylated DNA repair protein (DNA oxidative demethylase)
VKSWRERTRTKTTPARNLPSAASADLPEGFVLHPEFLSAAEEAALTDFLGTLAFGGVRMHGVAAKRRVAQFGWRYSFESYRLTEGAPLPPPLHDLRDRTANLANVEPAAFSEALVTKYTPGAGIGWHRDAPHFGVVAGISLGSPCRMRFRTGEAHARQTVAVDLPARSLYLLTGAARNRWQHMIPPVSELRWSVTFRTLRKS